MATTAPGQRLGRYHLIEPLGGGPCGEVYRAKVVGVAGMDRHFAVKRMHPAMVLEPGVSAKLSQACRTYAALDHPRIARLSELGVGNGETFTVTDLVSGLDLNRLAAAMLQTGRGIPAGPALGLVSAAARAVGYAHGRGVSHWGLCPTNLLATADGDVRITDFGVLACRLGARPAEDPSLHARLAYLAPEQLLGEPVSAATDVFALGVLAYELVAGARPFAGGSALELEQAILSARPAALELPRPVARVIDRCLARSPFERFPDARALADALDAALRLAPLAGDRRELGDKVREALEHLAAVHESQLSGAFSFAIPMAPTPPLPPPTPVRARAAGPAGVPLPLPPIPSPSGAVRGAARQHTLETAAVPPPIAIPPAASAQALFGAKPAASKSAMPTVSVPIPVMAAAAAASMRDEPAIPVPMALMPVEHPPFTPAPSAAPVAPTPPGRTTPPMPMPAMSAVDEGPPAAGGEPQPTIFESLWPPTEQVPIVRAAGDPDDLFAAHAAAIVGRDADEPSIFGSSSTPMVPMVPYAGAPAGPLPPPPSMLLSVPGTAARRGGGRRALWLGLGALALAGAAFATVTLLRDRSAADDEGGEQATAPTTSDAGQGAGLAAPLDAAALVAEELDAAALVAEELDATAMVAVEVDAAAMATAPVDAGQPVDAAAVAVVIDAAPPAIDARPPVDARVAVDAAPRTVVDAAEPVVEPDPPATGDTLVLALQPRGARVYVDGREVGKSPVTVPGADGQRQVAAILGGYRLYTATVDGRGRHDASLAKAPAWGGSGGIKVRCKIARRFYVFVDGKDTGQLCPTERIGVKLGKHTVEIYDPVTRARRSFPADVVDTDHSLKVDVE